MSSDRKKARKRKQREDRVREKLLAGRKKLEVVRRRSDHAREYPPFEFDTAEAGDPGFVTLVREAVRSFDYEREAIPRYELATFQLMRRYGFHYALRHFREAMKGIEERDAGTPSGQMARLAEVDLFVRIGDIVFGKIGADALDPYLPWNAVQFVPEGRQFRVTFRSLLREPGGMGTVYYSRLRPTVAVGGRDRVVAFSKHAIDRVCERLNPRWRNFDALGDVFAHLNNCTYYEAAALHPDKIGFTFYDACGDSRFADYRYVTAVLGGENLDPRAGRPYYRLGYCPAVVEGDFVKAKTLLVPGYAGTPEYGLIVRSGLPREERERMMRAAREADGTTLLRSDGLSLVKWFHDNGVPQVIQTHRKMFHYW